METSYTLTPMQMINYCNYCEQTWISDVELVKECPDCAATVCEKCEDEGLHQGCNSDIWLKED